MIKDHFSKPTRGWVDSSMAGLANNFAIACPNCKRSDDAWDPAPIEKPKKLKQEFKPQNESTIR